VVERLYRPEEAAREVLGIGRTLLYAMMARGEIRSLVVAGRNRRIPASALQDYIDRQKALQWPADDVGRDPAGQGGRR
jgi:excisionase family DNA binding protein